MLPTHQGSIRLFRLAGISVFLHWSWFVVALFEVNNRGREYGSVFWNVLEYLSLFLIVLMHEFGHSLACRQVGGKADQIVLWPLGGVAYVAPPQRPGATLWSIAAGPLVNVLLFPVLTALLVYAGRAEWPSDFIGFIRAVWVMNSLILAFNLMPVYPLDGGQMLRSVLWFFIGRARSLMVASIIGFIGVGLLILLAVFTRSIWLGIMAVFIVLNCWGGLQQARVLSRLARLPRRDGFACPQCGERPVMGPYWRCPRCGAAFDVFENREGCPRCMEPPPPAVCVECGASTPVQEWVKR